MGDTHCLVCCQVVNAIVDKFFIASSFVVPLHLENPPVPSQYLKDKGHINVLVMEQSTIMMYRYVYHLLVSFLSHASLPSLLLYMIWFCTSISWHLSMYLALSMVYIHM